MDSMVVRLCGLTGALLALPLLELELLDYIRGLEFRTFLSQSLLLPFFTALVNFFIQIFVNGLFGVV